MKDQFKVAYQNLLKIAQDRNEKFLLEYEKDSQMSMASKEGLSLLVSECLLEDAEAVQKFKTHKYKNRYTDAIIRNMCEQVIEYLFILKNPNRIPEYFGENLKEEYDENADSIELFKQFGKARFKSKSNIAAMAEAIGERSSTDDKLSLYDIFSIKAELEHNSYFHSIYDVVGEIEDGKAAQKDVDDMDYLFMSYILAAFIDAYDEYFA